MCEREKEKDDQDTMMIIITNTIINFKSLVYSNKTHDMFSTNVILLQHYVFFFFYKKNGPKYFMHLFNEVHNTFLVNCTQYIFFLGLSFFLNL